MSNGNGDTPPWEGKRNGSAKGLLRRLIPWLIVGALVAVVAMGLKPKPVEVETGVVARAPLTVRVSEEGKTRIRNRYVVAAPLAGRMRRVPLKPGDEVKAGETVLTAIEPVAVDPLRAGLAALPARLEDLLGRPRAATVRTGLPELLDRTAGSLLVSGTAILVLDLQLAIDRSHLGILPGDQLLQPPFG